MKRTVLAVLMAAAAISTSAQAKRAPAPPPPDPVDEVIKAEQAFDAYTFQHGITHGFHAFSTPDALTFAPGPVRTHEETAAAIAKDPSESDAPSKLRWWPVRAGASASGDLAYDLGAWTNGDSPNGGWYFTVWQKQADGQWLWVIDTGAGRAEVAVLPPKQPISSDFKPAGSSDTAKAASDEVGQSESVLNKALGLQTAPTAYNGFLATNAIVTQDGAPPAQTNEAYPSALAARPSDLLWTMDFGAVSKAGDYGYTYGHANDAAKVTKGYYVRVWRKDGPELADWHVVADVFHAAK